MIDSALLHRLLRFGVVGVTVMGFFMALNWLFGRMLGANAAFLASYPPALGLHYLLNKRWTFRDASRTDARKLGAYLHTVVVTFLIQWPVFTLGRHWLGWPAWVSAGLANLAQMTASFLLMQWRVFHPRAAADATPPGGAWERLGNLFITLGVSALLFWTVMGDWWVPPFHGDQHDYYNLLAHGFAKGKLSLDLEVSAALQTMANPWDPAQRAHVLVPPDVSYYGGRFYLYFGVTPVLTLFWPFRVLTGVDLPLGYGLTVFCLGSFWVLGWLWLRVMRDNHPGASWLVRAGGLLTLGLAGGLQILARRANFWEVPIAAGQFFLSLALAGGYLARRSGRPGPWLAAAGGALGLATGARPVLIVASLALGWLAFRIGAAESQGRSRAAMLRHIFVRAAQAGGPLVVIVAGLLAYNRARFGQWLEFGLNYQLTSVYEAKAQHFSPGYVWFNWIMYFWRAPLWGRYFPFISQGAMPPMPAGYYTCEFVYGALVVCPILWFAGCLPFGLFTRERRGTPFPDWVIGLALTAGATTAVLLCFNTAVSRYTADFLPWCLALSLLGWAAGEEASVRRSRAAGFLVRAVGITAVVYSCFMAFLASSTLHGMLRDRNPRAYRTLGRWFNRPTAWWEAWRGEQTGPVEMDVVFPVKPGEPREPLLVTGRVQQESDLVFVEYIGPGKVRLGYESWGRPWLRSEELAVQPGRTYHLRIESGSLYPPPEHPAFAAYTGREIDWCKDWVRVTLDGRVLIDAPQSTYEVSPATVTAGLDRRAYRDSHFSGTITHVRRMGLPRPLDRVGGGGDISLRLNLPAPRPRPVASDPPPARFEPLVCAGQRGNADLLSLRSNRDGSITFGYESWSAGFWQSPAIPFPANGELDLRLRLGSILALDEESPLRVLRGTIAVWLDGRPVWWRPAGRPLAPEPPVAIGANSVGSSAVDAEFSGRIGGWDRQAAGPVWRSGPMAGVRLTLGGRGRGTEPLVAVGVTGAADTLAIEWLPADRARLVYDHWGEGLHRGPEIPWPDNEAQTIEVRMPSFAMLDQADRIGRVDHGPLEVRVNGRAVWDETLPCYIAASRNVVLGRNPAGSSVAQPALSGVVLDISQISPEPAR